MSEFRRRLLMTETNLEPKSFIIGYQPNVQNYFYYSLNEGSTWTRYYTAGSYCGSVGISEDLSVMFAGGANISYTKNGGKNWDSKEGNYANLCKNGKALYILKRYISQRLDLETNTTKSLYSAGSAYDFAPVCSRDDSIQALRVSNAATANILVSTDKFSTYKTLNFNDLRGFIFGGTDKLYIFRTSGLYLSSDIGESFIKLIDSGTGTLGDGRDVDCFDKLGNYGIMWDRTEGYLYRTTDGFLNYNIIPFSSETSTNCRCSTSSSGKYMLLAPNGKKYMYLSKDYGNTFIQFDIPYNNGSNSNACFIEDIY